jgi:hypothetical protein
MFGTNEQNLFTEARHPEFVHLCCSLWDLSFPTVVKIHITFCWVVQSRILVGGLQLSDYYTAVFFKVDVISSGGWRHIPEEWRRQLEDLKVFFSETLVNNIDYNIVLRTVS